MKLKNKISVVQGLPKVSFASARVALEKAIKEMKSGSLYVVIDHEVDPNLKNETVIAVSIPDEVSRTLAILQASHKTGRDVSALNYSEQDTLVEAYRENDDASMASILTDCEVLESDTLDEIASANDYILSVAFNGRENANNLYKVVSASVNAARLANQKANAKSGSVPLLKISMVSSKDSDEYAWLRVEVSTKETTLNSTKAKNVLGKMIAKRTIQPDTSAS